MTATVIFFYLLVLVLGAGLGLAHNYLQNDGQFTLPDAVLSAVLYAVLAEMVLVTAHLCSLWNVEAPDIDLDIE